MKLLKSYLFWTYERGSVHYDVMVTLILIFLFVSPQFIDYGARPVATVPLRDTEVLVKGAGDQRAEESVHLRNPRKPEQWLPQCGADGGRQACGDPAGG